MKEKVLIYGVGKFFFKFEKEINEKYCIEAFIDKRKEGFLHDKKIIRPDELEQYGYDKILVMVQDIQECINIAKMLIAQKVNYDQIMLGHNFYGNYSECIENISVLPDGNLSVTINKITLKVKSKDEFNNTYEILVNQMYYYFINNEKRDIVFDIGLNIGDAALFFLNDTKVKKVYAFEPFKETYLAAKDNLKEHFQSERIEIFQYGLSCENSKRIIGFNSDMSCGQSSIADTRKKTYDKYLALGLVQSEQEKQEEIEVRRASEVLLPIIEKHPDCNFILKMNCEGEEYNIVEELADAGILDKVSFIMLEWHYKGKNNILQHLKKAGFSYWCNDKTQELGFIYAYQI